MSPESHPHIARIHRQAAELDEPSRGEFLENACRGDAQLKREVELLLAADQTAAASIDTLAATKGAVDGLPRPWSAGHRISHYEISSLLGAGGMGQVYLTVDRRLQRRVALPTIWTQCHPCSEAATS